MYLRHGLDVSITENTRAKNKNNFPATGISPDENLFFCDDFGKDFDNTQGLISHKLAHERLDSQDVAHKCRFCGKIIMIQLVQE